MAQCPVCNTPGAYIGFTTIECRNPDCEHFVIFEEEVCPCCGQIGHNPDMHALSGGDPANSGSGDPVGAVYLDYSDPAYEPAPNSQDSTQYDSAQP